MAGVGVGGWRERRSFTWGSAVQYSWYWGLARPTAECAQGTYKHLWRKKNKKNTLIDIWSLFIGFWATGLWTTHRLAVMCACPSVTPLLGSGLSVRAMDHTQTCCHVCMSICDPIIGFWAVSQGYGPHTDLLSCVHVHLWPHYWVLGCQSPEQLQPIRMSQIKFHTKSS